MMGMLYVGVPITSLIAGNVFSSDKFRGIDKHYYPESNQFQCKFCSHMLVIQQFIAVTMWESIGRQTKGMIGASTDCCVRQTNSLKQCTSATCQPRASPTRKWWAYLRHSASVFHGFWLPSQYPIWKCCNIPSLSLLSNKDVLWTSRSQSYLWSYGNNLRLQVVIQQHWTLTVSSSVTNAVYIDSFDWVSSKSFLDDVGVYL